ncbi:hypothetical protein RZE82_02100 [Mollicutes bacterium LVI A0039]|nr:hypothetical protein RZE82_02100 [Mollicutes bacterium LVI A0039]
MIKTTFRKTTIVSENDVLTLSKWGKMVSEVYIPNGTVHYTVIGYRNSQYLLRLHYTENYKDYNTWYLGGLCI